MTVFSLLKCILLRFTFHTNVRGAQKVKKIEMQKKGKKTAVKRSRTNTQQRRKRVTTFVCFLFCSMG